MDLLLVEVFILYRDPIWDEDYRRPLSRDPYFGTILLPYIVGL